MQISVKSQGADDWRSSIVLHGNDKLKHAFFKKKKKKKHCLRAATFELSFRRVCDSHCVSQRYYLQHEKRMYKTIIWRITVHHLCNTAAQNNNNTRRY